VTGVEGVASLRGSLGPDHGWMFWLQRDSSCGKEMFWVPGCLCVPDVICLYMLRAVLARDPQSVIFYDSRGQFVGVRRPGSGKPIQVKRAG
jgi:hypothetical protein